MVFKPKLCQDNIALMNSWFVVDCFIYRPKWQRIKLTKAQLMLRADEDIVAAPCEITFLNKRILAVRHYLVTLTLNRAPPVLTPNAKAPPLSISGTLVSTSPAIETF